jgi:transketolase
MRNEFIKHLVELAEKDESIALVVGDLGFGVVEPFAERFPNRFFNSGVAEQNMMGLAAGLASEGYHVFVYSIANFPIFRCAEQIRNDVCYHDLPVTVVSVGGGLAYGNLGYSHHAVQDFSFMRVLPGMTILAPGDPNETKKCLDFLVRNPGPSYLRLGKTGEKNYSSALVLQGEGAFEPILSNESSKTAVISTGAALQNIQKILKELKLTDINLLTCPIWGIEMKKNVNKDLAKYNKIISVEDHLIDGGFGSWVLESLEASARSKLRILGLDKSVCGRVGSQNYLNELGGINSETFGQMIAN